MNKIQVWLGVIIAASLITLNGAVCWCAWEMKRTIDWLRRGSIHCSTGIEHEISKAEQDLSRTLYRLKDSFDKHNETIEEEARYIRYAIKDLKAEISSGVQLR